MEAVRVSLLFVLIYVSASNGNGVKNASFSGIAFEMLLTKLEYLQNNLEFLQEKIETMESAMKEADQKLLSAINQQNVVLQTQCKKDQESFEQKLSSGINQLTQNIDDKFRTIDKKINQQNDNVNVLQTDAKKDRELFDKTLAGVTGAINQLGQTINHNFTLLQDHVKSAVNIPQTFSCKSEPSKRSGKYLIQPPGFEGYCEQATFGGGWLVFQFRFNGSVDFFRNWMDYRNGFGSLDGEFWLGLEHLHRLTSARPHELLVELKDFKGIYKYARYDHFEIASESEQYALKRLGNHTGTAVDALALHKGMKFSTKDRDNDRWSGGDCSSDHKGAWWYDACYYSNLNGLYKNEGIYDFIDWTTSDTSFPQSYTRMSIRET